MHAPQHLLLLAAAVASTPLGVAGLEQVSTSPSELLVRQSSGSGQIPIQISNQCPESIWPAIITQGGTGPSNTGYEAKPDTNQTLYVSEDWQGRVWGRTNCSFTSGGSAAGPRCSTGDCGNVLGCKGPGENPATLAEFTLQGSDQQSFYDISLVDGYNLPMAIVLNPNNNAKLEALDPATTNPSCVASVGDVAPTTFNPYSSGQQFLGTSSNSPLPFETSETPQKIESWCPWDLQVSPPLAPGTGVYPYPDGNVQRPAFNPCLSACAKYSEPKYCCTGAYNRPDKCSASYYSKAAKAVCPDAYSFAYDDQDSTFIVPQGGGFSITFCPGGRSTRIIAQKGEQAIKHGGSGGGSASSGSSSLRAGWPRHDVTAAVWRLGLVGVLACMVL